jgi:hypothetical protein
MKPFFYGISDEYPQFTFIEVDIDKLSEAAEKAQVTAMPTFVAYGKSIEGPMIIKRMAGSSSERQLFEFVRSCMQIL